jgi:hypothetical protein
MSDRAVASSSLAKWLGLDVVSDEVYADHKGEKGSVSADLRETMPNIMPLNEKMYTNRAANQNPDFDDIEANEYGEENNWQQDEHGVWHQYSGDRHFQHNFQDPVTQRGLADLQLFDAITGQVDRHGGNIYVDPRTGKVKGIDHDMSFGAGQDTLDTTWGKYHGLPSQVDEKTAKRILKKKAKNLPKVLRGKHGGLSDKEIKDAQSRFREVKRYLREQKKNNKLIRSWDSTTYQDALNEANHTQGQSLERSYVKRSAGLMGQAQEIAPVPSMERTWMSGLLEEEK